MADEQEHDEGVQQERMQRWRKMFAGMSLRELVDKMVDTRSMKDNLEAELKEVNAAYDVLRFEMIPDKMETDGVETVRYEGIGRVSLTPDLRVATKPGMKNGLFDWLKKHRLSDLIQPGINASTLKAWVKDRMKQGKEVPSEYLNVTPITRASITKG